jgi:hypothetical protein
MAKLDRAGLQVLADELLEKGDVRGEAIALRLAMRDNPGASAAWGAFLARRGRELLGEVLSDWLSDDRAKVEWGDGLVERLRLHPWPMHPYERRASDDLPAIFASPALSLGRIWELEVGAFESNASLDPLWQALPPLPALEYFSVGEARGTYVDEHQITWLGAGAIGAVVARYPSLRRVVCRGSWPDFAGIAGPVLEELIVVSSTLSPQAMAAIAAAPLPALQTLNLCIGDGEYGPCAALEDAAALLEAPWPSLRHLGICNAVFSDELIPILAKSPLLGRLKSIDLSRGLFSWRGARVLVERRTAFAHLERIELGASRLDRRDRESLTASLPSVTFAYGDGYRQGRYVSISE